MAGYPSPKYQDPCYKGVLVMGKVPLGVFMFLLGCMYLVAEAMDSRGLVAMGRPSAKDKEWILPLLPKDNPLLVKLGELLFFDSRLSRTNSMSCATCHDPQKGWSDNLPVSRDTAGVDLPRASPSLVNTGYSYLLMWDGGAKGHEEQAVLPIKAPRELNTDMSAVTNLLKTDPQYLPLVSALFPVGEDTLIIITTALSAFEKTIVATTTPFDRWLKGDPSALTPAQVRGFDIFISPSKGDCATCHRPPNFTDGAFHNLGFPSTPLSQKDVGRYEVVRSPLNKYAFKTPQLRGISSTPPYFHQGVATTLRDVVEHYVAGGIQSTSAPVSKSFKAITLSEQEIQDLLDFLQNGLTMEVAQ